MSDNVNRSAHLQSDYVPSIGYIEEVIINILSRLPVKTVVACKCVAKHWLRLISEPRFPLLQLSWAKKKPKYIICPYPEDYDTINHLSLLEEDGNTIEVPLFGFEEVCSPEITCFLNGLVCSVNENCDGQNDIDITIFNPITRDSVLLPKGTPSTVIPSVGISFDPKTNDYRAFRFFSDSSTGGFIKFKCEVHDSGSTGWRIIADDVERPQCSPVHPFCPYYATIEGTLYWFVSSRAKPECPLAILSVDLNDTFVQIGLPTRLHEWSFLVEIEGCLGVVTFNYQVYYGQVPKPHLEVYKFENSVWHLLARSYIDLFNVHSFNSVASRDTEIFFIIRHEDESVCYLIFDFVQQSYTTLDLDEQFEDSCPVAFPFVESLLKCSRT